MAGQYVVIPFFFFNQKTAYELRISDWSSDVCSSDLYLGAAFVQQLDEFHADMAGTLHGVTALADFLVTVFVVQRGHQALQHAVRGERRGVAGTAMHLMHTGDEIGFLRSEERSVGKECVRTYSSRWSQMH